MPTITIKTPNDPSQRFEVSPNRETVSLGRSSKSDITIACESVSGQHATIRKLDDGYVLRDLGSTNGTKLDGKKVSEIHLEGGLDIKLGDVVFTFEANTGTKSVKAETKTQASKKKASSRSKADPQEEIENNPVVLGLTLMGTGLIILGLFVLIGMEAIKAIAERGQGFIIGGCALILAGILTLASILFVTGRVKLPKLVVQFKDDDDEDEEPKKKKKKKERKKNQDEDEDPDDGEDSKEDKPEDKDEDADKELGKSPKDESKKED